MYSTINEFNDDWLQEKESTLKIFGAIPSEKLSFKLNNESRTIGRLAWHITQTITEMPKAAGLIDRDILANKNIPILIDEIILDFTTHSSHLLDALNKKWIHSTLEDTVKIYGQTWSKAKLLTVLTKHLIHHRAQITILMRAAGLKVPGIYGPSREEWKQFGMEPKA